jgi:hypothetical protein
MKFSKRTDGQYRASTLIQFTVHPFDICLVLEEVWRHRKRQGALWDQPKSEASLGKWLASLTRESCEGMVRDHLTARGKLGLKRLAGKEMLPDTETEMIEARVRALYPKETAE